MNWNIKKCHLLALKRGEMSITGTEAMFHFYTKQSTAYGRPQGQNAS